MSFEQFAVMVGWLFGAFLAVACIELLAFVGLYAIRTSTLVSSLCVRMVLLLVLIAVSIGSIVGTIVFVLSRISLPPAT